MAGRTAVRTITHDDGRFAASFVAEDFTPRSEDYDWIARELGDVPMRIIDADSADWLTDGPATTIAVNIDIPYKSLGREA